MRSNIIKLTNILILFILMGCSPGNKYQEISEDDFINPPNWAKPLTWMHIMSGNMTKEGLTKDLEAISDVGIGGVLLFNIAQGIPYGDIEFNSAEHHELLKHAGKECERLGMSFGLHNCDGWTSSGGPWIMPEESMKMLTYRQSVFDGGTLNVKLPQPTMREGFYRDIAVLAYPSFKEDVYDNNNIAKVTSSDNRLNLSIINDKREDELTFLRKEKGKETFVLFDYGKTVPISSVYISSEQKPGKVILTVSDDGRKFKEVKSLFMLNTGKKEWCCLDSFEPVYGRYYKLVFDNSLAIREINLSSQSFISDCLFKNLRGRMDDIRINRQYGNSIGCIDSDSLLDLSSFLDKDGTLRCTLPSGKWTVMRIGYTSTGARNHPASESGRGLECDKFSKSAIEKHFNSFSQKVIDNIKPVAPNALRFLEIDSYEQGGQNWTEGFEEIFKAKKGYDIRTYLPVLLGKYMDSAQKSEDILDDFREVCCELMADNYYGHFAELCHKNGIEFYLEPYGGGPFNSLFSGGKCDIPMGEFWMNSNINVKIPVSAAHIYGKNIVSAEAFTSRPEINWKGHPGMAKATGDRAWLHGINEFVFHRYAHQANTHVRPGMTMGHWGFHFDRTQTWWNSAGREWFKYMSRGTYMLQQGVPVVDILVFVGDASPNSAVSISCDGFNYDAVNSDVLKNRITVKDSEMVLPEGISYKVLLLRNCDRIKLETLERICQLVESGVPVVGKLPTRILGYNNSDESFTRMMDLNERIRKSGNYCDEDGLDDLLKNRQIEKDFYTVSGNHHSYDFVHRRMGNGTDIYFISNMDSIPDKMVCNFRVGGKIPELWYAMDGRIVSADKYSVHKNRTEVTIDLNANESVFIVFRNKAVNKDFELKRESQEIVEKDLTNDWTVEFNKEYGLDTLAFFPKLTDLSRSDNDEIKYYSGTSVYRKEIIIDDDEYKGTNKALLNLGKVYICAEIFVNGNYVSTKWIAPFETDIYKYLKPGVNKLEIIVTNQWTNRLIGDERYPKQDDGYVHDTYIPTHKMKEWYVKNRPMPEGPRITFCTGQFYSKDDPLIPAGLVGPVSLHLINETCVYN